MKPTGIDFNELPNDLFRGLTDYLKRMVNTNEDDEFFHITCHVDPNMKAKIGKGEYVDLKKLLPKDRMRGNDDQTLTLVNKDGHTYFVPTESGSKITNIRWWEQAFCVYAAIYSNANPGRSAEIWQYAYVINMAVSSYIWENGAHYDFTFRQLMNNYPNRSWAKVYNQQWNLSMQDPTLRNSQSMVHNTVSNFSGGGGGMQAVNNHKYGDWKDNCC